MPEIGFQKILKSSGIRFQDLFRMYQMMSIYHQPPIVVFLRDLEIMYNMRKFQCCSKEGCSCPRSTRFWPLSVYTRSKHDYEKPEITFYIAKVLNWDLARECLTKYLVY